MRVLLHTPLKSPDSPIPSGDREMARGLAAPAAPARPHGGDAGAEPRRRRACPRRSDHLALERRARAQAQRLIARWRALPARHPERFDLWFTYHCYYRKPDWLGPIVTRALGVPYVLVEASHAPRRAQGPTRLGHRAVERALAAADLVLTRQSARRRRREGAAAAGRASGLAAALHRHATVRVAAPRAANDPPLLLSVGMMRTRDKLDSYRVLAEALRPLKDKPGARCWSATGRRAARSRR